MPLYLSSFVYIFATLEIFLPYPSVVEKRMGWECNVVFGKGPAGTPLESGRLIV